MLKNLLKVGAAVSTLGMVGQAMAQVAPVAPFEYAFEGKFDYYDAENNCASVMGYCLPITEDTIIESATGELAASTLPGYLADWFENPLQGSDTGFIGHGAGVEGAVDPATGDLVAAHITVGPHQIVLDVISDLSCVSAGCNTEADEWIMGSNGVKLRPVAAAPGPNFASVPPAPAPAEAPLLCTSEQVQSEPTAEFTRSDEQALSIAESRLRSANRMLDNLLDQKARLEASGRDTARLDDKIAERRAEIAALEADIDALKAKRSSSLGGVETITTCAPDPNWDPVGDTATTEPDPVVAPVNAGRLSAFPANDAGAFELDLRSATAADLAGTQFVAEAYGSKDVDGNDVANWMMLELAGYFGKFLATKTPEVSYTRLMCSSAAGELAIELRGAVHGAVDADGNLIGTGAGGTVTVTVNDQQFTGGVTAATLDGVFGEYRIRPVGTGECPATVDLEWSVGGVVLASDTVEIPPAH